LLGAVPPVGGLGLGCYSCSEVVVQEYENLKQLVAEVEEDIRKADGGNKAAQTRVRKQMQDIKNAAQVIREKCLELRDQKEP